MDGVGIVGLISSLMDEFDRSAFLRYRSFSTLQKYIAWIIFPFFFFYNFAMSLFMMINGNNPWRVAPNGQVFFPKYNKLKEPCHEHFEKDMNWS